MRTPPAPPPPGPLPTALAEPTRNVRSLWVAGISLANLGMWMAFFGPLQVLLPEQVGRAAPADKETVLAWVTGIGAAMAMVATPLAGALSDRTTGPLGRRRPWVLAGAVLGGAGLVVLGTQESVAGILLGWSFVQTSLSCLNATLLAAVPDHVPRSQRGAVSGWVGIPQSAGVVAAVVLVTVVVTEISPGYTLIGVLTVACVLPFALLSPDPPLPRGARPPWRDFARGLWVSPRRHPDFAWAFLTRFLIGTGNAMFILYLLYFLRDEVGYEDLFPGSSATDGLLTLILVYTAAVVATTVVAGVVSDRLGKRRGMVSFAGVVMGLPAFMVALSPTWTSVLVCAVVLGVGFGVFLSVDNALVTEVLPTAEGRAKDLGIVNIASSGPQVIAPALAGPIVVHLGGYPVLYTACGVISLLGAAVVWRIRGVA
ncbi:MFS transporter [Nocardiopsis terrae]|uniref:MFS family permease n=1 Tax=Nocardiopsis terrae TaxID=372655 RepID=A0ABR9HE39_9ACTN|nr:MFS transporter [Nocardiopsis terrae]MBE1457274.1 MFS family permease [Nocardiopsis terrae]GHC91504.1 MFS transporter [Nocardiopsis terrae]